MTLLEYVAKFTELACFTYDHVATYMAKVRKFEDGLKLSIRSKIVGLLLQDTNLIVKTAMAIKKEVNDAQNIWDTVLKIRGMRANLILLAQGRSRGLLLRKGFRERVVAIRAKVKVNHPRVGETSRLLANQGRGHVSIATNIDTRGEISLRGRDPKVMGQPSPSHQWDVHRLGLFLPTLPWAKGANISPRALYKPLLLQDQARWARAWAEVEARAHKPGL